MENNNYEMKPMASVQEKDYGGPGAHPEGGVTRSQTTRVRVRLTLLQATWTALIHPAEAVQLHTDVLLRALVHAILGGYGYVWLRRDSLPNDPTDKHAATSVWSSRTEALGLTSGASSLSFLVCCARSHPSRKRVRYSLLPVPSTIGPGSSHRRDVSLKSKNLLVAFSLSVEWDLLPSLCIGGRSIQLINYANSPKIRHLASGLGDMVFLGFAPGQYH